MKHKRRFILAKDIRVRYAPSPTGLSHIAMPVQHCLTTLCTSSWRYFIIRIEDTDRKRHVEDGERSQLDNLRWLGIDWDESLKHTKIINVIRYLPLYQKYIDQLFGRR